MWAPLAGSDRKGCPPPAVAITTAGFVVRVGRGPWPCLSCRDCIAGSWRRGSRDGPNRCAHGGCGDRLAGSYRIRLANSDGGVVRCRTTRTASHRARARRDAATAMPPSSPPPMPGSTVAPPPRDCTGVGVAQSSTCDHARLDRESCDDDDCERYDHDTSVVRVCLLVVRRRTDPRRARVRDRVGQAVPLKGDSPVPDPARTCPHLSPHLSPPSDLHVYGLSPRGPNSCPRCPRKPVPAPVPAVIHRV
jgi:hypothetical protein